MTIRSHTLKQVVWITHRGREAVWKKGIAKDEYACVIWPNKPCYVLNVTLKRLNLCYLFLDKRMVFYAGRIPQFNAQDIAKNISETLNEETFFSWFLPFFLDSNECFFYSWKILFHCFSFNLSPKKWKKAVTSEEIDKIFSLVTAFCHDKMLPLVKIFCQFPH